MKSRIAPARVASTDCISSRPLSSSTATDIVSRWTSIPRYLTLFIRVFLSLCFGCCFSHQPQPTPKGAPFYNACPILAFFARACPELCRRGGWRCGRCYLVYACGRNGQPTFAHALSTPALRKGREGRGTHCVGGTDETKG